MPTPHIEKSIWVTAEFEGLHQWPNAPDDVAFLRVLHRHMFKVTLFVSVSHSDRAVEFFQLKECLKDATDFVRFNLRQSPQASCEMMAEQIYGWFQVRHPHIVVTGVTVSEDGESGATLIFTKPQPAPLQ